MPEIGFYDTRSSPARIALLLPDGAKPIQPGWTLAHVMHAAGLFPSVGQAKNNGWNKPIPDGYSEYVVGKLRTVVSIAGYVKPCKSVCADCVEGCVYLA